MDNCRGRNSSEPAVRVLPSGCLHRARRGELLNLWWRDVDLDAAEVRITGSNFQPCDP